MAKVFVSHSSHDRDLANEVHDWLTGDGHDVFLDYHPDDGIAVGEEWEQRLYERLRWADAMICLVTSAYITSAWCAAEVGVARSRGSRLLPLLAERGVEYPLLEWSQYADLATDPVAARAALTAALRRVDAAGGWGWPDGRSPFPGLRPFDVDQHQVFFGRAAEIQALAELLRSPAERAGRGVLLVVGPSGCGKSSLVRAGLLPMVAEEPDWWTLSPLVPGADPVAALTRELAANARQIGLGWTVAQVQERLENGRLGELADELLLATPGLGRRRHLLVVVDQFEELLTQATPTARTRFAELLQPTLDNPVQLMATLRPEFLAQLLANPELASLPTRVFTLRPLRRSALATVIKGPAQLAGIEVDEELADRLVADTDSREALPLLAFTLEQLAEGVGRGGQLSAGRYEQLGGVQGALIRQADAALSDACSASGRDPSEVISGLLRLVTVDEEGRPTRWRVDRAELPEPVRLELDAFVGRRLLTIDTDSDVVVLGVTHEAFLSAWPPLAAAITATESGLRMRRAVEQAAAEWERDGRPSSRLWGHGQLAAAVNDTAARIQRISRSGDRPTDASSSRPRRLLGWLPRLNRAVTTDKVELSRQARVFLHTCIRLDRRRRRRATTILSVLLALAVTAAGLAANRQRAAELQQRVATARGLVVQADAARASDPRLALLLGIAAQRIHPNAETQASLVKTLTNTPYAGTLMGHTGAVLSVAFAPRGRILATGGSDGTVILWDVADPTRPRRVGQPFTNKGPNSDPDTNQVWSMAFTPDGRTLATTNGSHRGPILWDVTDSAHPRRLLTIRSQDVETVAFTPDGRILATGDGGTVSLWDVADPTRSRRLGQPLTAAKYLVRSVAFGNNGRILAIGGDTGTVSLWNVTDPAQLRRLSQPVAAHNGAGKHVEVKAVAFASDGQTLAIGNDDGTVLLFDVADPAQPRRLSQPLTSQEGGGGSVAFAPDGRTLATSGGDGVILWDLADRTHPSRLGQPLTSQEGGGGSVAFAPDGRTLATSGGDGSVVLWDLADRTEPSRLGQPLTGQHGAVVSLAFALNSQILAAGNEDGTVILWDVTDPGRPRRLGKPLTGHRQRVNSVAFAADGRLLASGSDDTTVILWDVTDPVRPRHLGKPLSSHRYEVNSVAFAPSGRMLATSDFDGVVILWDLTDAARPRQVGQFSIGSGQVWSIAFAPDGRTLAVGSTNRYDIIWDLADPTRPRRLGPPITGLSSDVGAVAFAPDGRTLATGSDDRTIILWDLADRTHPRRLGEPLTGYSGGVFAPDGRTLATTNSNQVILWDLADRAQPSRLGQPLTGHRQPIWATVFAPDGHTLATSSSDGTVILRGLVARQP